MADLAEDSKGSSIPDRVKSNRLLPISLRTAGQAVAGGTLMGLANLVPGISGGTMLLATGVYPAFVDAIAELSTLRFRIRSIALLAVVGTAAVIAIGACAGTVKSLVVEHRFLMYSLFIGLTLGGVPVVWRLIRRPTSAGVIGGAIVGFLVMGLLAWFQHAAGTTLDQRSGVGFMFVAGIAGASAMILPGVSGGYLLLVLGVYVPLLSAIDVVKESVRAGELAGAWDPLLSVVLPVGLGVLIGVVLVSNLLKFVLQRFPEPTYGVLLGLLIGAVVGLWPFQEGKAPAIGNIFKGQRVTPEMLESLSPEKYPTEFFSPTPLQMGLAVVGILVGFVVTYAVAAISRAGSSREPS